MTARHIAGLYFDNSKDAAKKRIQKLKKLGVIAEQARHVNEPAVLYLTHKGFLLIYDEGILSEYPDVSRTVFAKRAQISPLTRRHELDVIDVKTAFVTAIRDSTDLSVAQFSTWPALHRFTANLPHSHGGKAREINPDGFIHVTRRDGSGEFFFYLEVDRSSETQAILAFKASCYSEFYRSGGFSERQGHPPTDHEQFPFRVLVVCKNAERRNNAAAQMLTLRTPILRQAWLTTIEEVGADPLGAIWNCPIDYAAATKGTPFDPYKMKQARIYRTQKEREIFVEERIEKRSLFL
jgi:hypothetical protein